MKKTTVAELIDFLQKQPQHYAVESLAETFNGFQTDTEWIDIEPKYGIGITVDRASETIQFGRV